MAWGHPDYGGSNVPSANNVVGVSCGGHACVARKLDGTVVAWGDLNKGGDAPPATDVVHVHCGGHACAALKSNGDAMVWGDSSFGGVAAGIILEDIADISCGTKACVARTTSGRGHAWGHSKSGGYVKQGILTNMGPSPAAAIRQNLDWFVEGGFSWSEEDLTRFLNVKVSRGELSRAGGDYKLPEADA